MTITFVNSTVVMTSGGASLTPAIPTGAQSGDLMVAICFRGGNGASETWDDNGGGGNGWTALSPNNYDATDRDVESRLFYKIHTGTESDPTFTHGGSYALVCILLAFRGVDNTTPFDVTYNNTNHYVYATDTANPTNSAITTVTDGAWAILLCGQTDNNITGIVVPTGYTARGDSAGNLNRQAFVATKEIATAGTETPAAWANTGADGTEESQAYTLAIRPAGVGVTRLRRTMKSNFISYGIH